jgi:hypothetical protein
MTPDANLRYFGGSPVHPLEAEKDRRKKKSKSHGGLPGGGGTAAAAAAAEAHLVLEIGRPTMSCWQGR